jgi:hypothetical protein
MRRGVGLLRLSPGTRVAAARCLPHSGRAAMPVVASSSRPWVSVLPLRATPAVQRRHHGGGGHRHGHDHDHNPLGFLKRLWPFSGGSESRTAKGHHHPHDAAPVTELDERRRVEERRKEVLESQRLSRWVTWAGLGANVALFLAKAAAAHVRVPTPRF